MSSGSPSVLLLDLQDLPKKLGGAPGPGAASGAALPFPQLSFFETHPGSSAVREVAVQWGKAVLMSLNGCNITPVRPSWLCTSFHPDFVPVRCPEPHCKAPGCRGNGFIRSADGKEYSLRVAHHKTSNNSK